MATGDLVKLGTLYVGNVKQIRAKNPVSTGDVPKNPNGLSIEIKDTDSDDSYKLHWRMVSLDGKTLLVADRNILTDVSYAELRAQGLVNGKEITISGGKYIIRLLSGGRGDNAGNGNGGYPTNNEYDRIISNNQSIPGLPVPNTSDLSGHNLSGAHNLFWNWDYVASWCSERGQDYSGTMWVATMRGGNTARYWNANNENMKTAQIGWRPVLEVLNASPSVVLAEPTNNKTLHENDTFNIDGTTSDADNGNTVTIRYQVNAETVRSIKAFVSDGKTLESFNKTLTFKSGKLYDGETAITGNLTDGVAHKLKVWATDDQGGTSTIIERDFYVVPNRAPSLTVEPPIINGNIDNDKFTVNGTYNDADGNATTVKYRINGGNSVQVASGTSGAFDFEVLFAQLTAGPNTIVVEAIDSYGAKTSKTVKLNKNVVSTEQLRSTARYKILPPTNKAQAVLLWIERDKDLTIDVSISMTMTGEAESFVPVTVSESVPIAAGSNTYEDTFFYEADSAKENIIVQIDMTRKSVDADDKITLISGVLE